MQIIFKRGVYNCSELTADQLNFLEYKKIYSKATDIIQITSGLACLLEDGTYKEFNNNLRYLEYLYDKKSK